MEAPDGSDKRVRKRTRKLSERHLAQEPPEKKRKRPSRSGAEAESGGASGRKASEREAKEDQEKSRAHKPRKLLVSYRHAHLKLSGVPILGRGSASRENTPSSVASGSVEGGAFPRRSIDVHFKNPNFTFSYLATNKKKTWRNMKQILAAERSLPWRPDDPTYSSIDAPPPLKPPKRYADMSGFQAKYTDPLTGMYFSTSDEFQLIRTLPTNIVQGYLALRGKLTI